MPAATHLLALVLLGVLSGAIVGSFLATAVLRWPAGRSVARGRSHCDGCGATLSAGELLPLVSWAVQRGRCRRCGAPIHPLHPATEIMAAAIGAIALAAAPGPLGAAGALFGWGLLLLALLDLRHFWLPDRATLPLLALGLVAAWAGAPSLAERLAGAAAGFGMLWLVAAAYRRARGRDGLGGGDPKLMAVIGAWLGPAALPFVLLLASLSGLAAALALALMGRAVTGRTRLPFGAFLAEAAFAVWVGAAVWHRA